MSEIPAYGTEYIAREAGRAAERGQRTRASLAALAMHHSEQLASRQAQALAQITERLREVQAAAADPATLAEALTEYVTDSAERAVLFLDALRRAGNLQREHADSGSPPVLVYDYEMVIDGRRLKRAVNYALVRITPTEDAPPAEPDRRPYIIIDPRAGHGAGIGGSKNDSQVGVAMHAGHPVYFVIFFPDPVPGQSIADVCAAEADFIRAVRERHPRASRPVVIGNCQGGWSTMLLSASNPDLTGPVVLNGAPMSYWAGLQGDNPMRYFGGLAGGVLPAVLMSDLNAGRFDGANLVLNFEMLNPGNTWFRKYYDLWRNVDGGVQRFLDFDRWWSGFYTMNTDEIRWIVENLFIGNRLARGGVMLDPHTYVSLRHVRAPIIVFASHGDNITPPQQALNWIADTYRDTHEIKACGQRIVYLLHEEVGHLGIFVSSRVAQKQHRHIVSTLKAVEALSPGLYEMVLEDKQGEGMDAVYTVSFQAREIDDILAIDDGREDEEMFAAVSKFSRIAGETYDIAFRPWLRSMVNPALAAHTVKAHPLRLRRSLLSDDNPAMSGVEAAAGRVREQRHPATEGNPFTALERLAADTMESVWAQWRATTDAWLELGFTAVYGSPLMLALGETDRAYERNLAEFDIHRLPQVQLILGRVGEGGFAEGVVRIFILLGKARGAIRQGALERADEVLRNRPQFAHLGDSDRNRIIHEQSVIVDLVPDVAIATLTLLLDDVQARREALELVAYVAGADDSLDPPVREMLDQVRNALGLPDDTLPDAINAS